MTDMQRLSTLVGLASEARNMRNEMSLVIFGALVTCLAFGSLIGE